MTDEDDVRVTALTVELPHLGTEPLGDTPVSGGHHSGRLGVHHILFVLLCLNFGPFGLFGPLQDREG